MAYTIDFSLALGSSKTGLTLAAQIVDTAGANVGSEVTTGFTEIGNGYYLWHCTTMPDDHRGGVKFYEDGVPGTILAFAAVNPEELETGDDVWGHATRTLTQSAAAVTAAVSGSDISIKRGDTVVIALTGLGSVAGRSKLWFTVKHSAGDTDAESILMVEETAGLLYVNGAQASQASDASLVVDDEDAGDITITLKPAATSALSPRAELAYDVQMLASGAVTTVTEGDAAVTADVTRSVA